MWNDANKILPDKDGDYLVVIKGAKIPTVLSFHADCGVFYDENHECYYKVTHWCPLPKLPVTEENIEPDNGGFIKSKIEFAIYFSLDEVITYRENLRFMLAYGDIPHYLRGKLGALLSNFENITGDRK